MCAEGVQCTDLRHDFGGDVKHAKCSTGREASELGEFDDDDDDDDDDGGDDDDDDDG